MNIFNLSALTWGDIFAGLQALFILVGFIFAIVQLRNQSRDSRTNVMFQLMQMFRDYDDIQVAFRPGGKWNDKCPETAEDWARIDNYLGLYEHCEVLIQLNRIEPEFFERAYRVPLENALLHSDVQHKLQGEYECWHDLWALCKRYNIGIPKVANSS